MYDSSYSSRFAALTYPISEWGDQISVIYGLAALFCAFNVITDYAEGCRGTIAPSWSTSATCIGRAPLTRRLPRPKSDLCQAAGVEACAYQPPFKKCIVSKPDREDRTILDVIYMAKVEIDDPFVESDPLAETDVETKGA
ncbi:hypothetical protein FMEXI_761 [Fusarium mexicanum]|uniref:Uncharacterized protein n=1 Tax=Fusarium mexicanum TaxID=751941 RepID=A0A8H5NA67_9HYPO|nr:hypothetical protein FMEXI_761 [Fusarium mexicanum]